METQVNKAIAKQGLVIATLFAIEPFDDIKISGDRNEDKEEGAHREEEMDGPEEEDPTKERETEEPTPTPEPDPIPDIKIPDRIRRDPTIEPGTDPIR